MTSLRQTCFDSERWFIEMMMLESIADIERLEKQVGYFWTLVKDSKLPEQERPKRTEIDIEYLKQAQIADILSFFNIPVRGKFFKLREEKTPSCTWYSNGTRWHDHGSGDDGDSIDLVIKLNNCSFVEACELLKLIV